MKNGLIALALASFLAGCTAMLPPRLQAQEYAQAARAQAEAGQIKWSEYYGIQYRTIADGRAEPGAAERMRILGDMRDSALAYERGQMTADQFAARRHGADMAIMAANEKTAAVYNQPRGKSASDEYAEAMAARAKKDQQINCTSMTTAGAVTTTCN